MDRFEIPTYYEEVCQHCQDQDCEPVEDGCDSVWGCEV